MNDVIQHVDNCRDLGITMQDDASFSLQIEKVCKKVRQKCGWINRTFYTRNPRFMRHMWNTLVQPHVDYCSQLWAPSIGPELEKVEGLLRNYTSKIPSIRHLSYWERLNTLKMNSEQRRIERYRIIYIWKILENLVPNCGIMQTSNDRLGRTCKMSKLKGPKGIQKLRQNSFQSTGPTLFNSLPKRIRDLTGMGPAEFKKQLDEYLTSIPDEPKVSGLLPTCLTPDAIHSNSIVHWIPYLQREARWRTPGN